MDEKMAEMAALGQESEEKEPAAEEKAPEQTPEAAGEPESMEPEQTAEAEAEASEEGAQAEQASEAEQPDDEGEDEAAVPAQDDLIERMAEGFREVAREMPGAFAGFDEIPEGAVRMAAEKGITLFDAILRYRYAAEQAARAERERARKAAEASVGSLASSAGVTHPEADAFTQAFARALA